MILRLPVLFARCVKQDGFYTLDTDQKQQHQFARCVKQDGFYTFLLNRDILLGLLGVLNKMGSIPTNSVASIKRCLLGVLNKMGSIPISIYPPMGLSLLGVLNKMGSIPLEIQPISKRVC